MYEEKEFAEKLMDMATAKSGNECAKAMKRVNPRECTMEQCKAMRYLMYEIEKVNGNKEKFKAPQGIETTPELIAECKAWMNYFLWISPIQRNCIAG